MDSGADFMRPGVVRSEQDGLVGIFGGALPRLVMVMFLLTPPELRVIAIEPGQPDIAERGVWIRFDGLEAKLPHQLVARGREILVDLGNPHHVIVKRANPRGIALWQGALDPAPD